MRALVDPFGARAFAVVTKYWTVADKNTLSISFGGLLLWNRLLWIGVGCAAFAFAYSRFSFAERRTKSKAAEQVEQLETVPAAAPMPHPRLTDSPWAKFLGSFTIHFRGMAKNTTFVVVVMIACLICTLALALGATKFQDNETYETFPVTYGVIDLIRAALDFFLIIIITYFSGALVWKDRDERMDEIADATPTPEWVSYAARLVTLIGMVMLIQTVALAAGIVVQAAHGYHRFQFGLYVHELLMRDASGFAFLAILAFLIHVLVPNKYIGYSVFIAFYFVNIYLWQALNVATNLVQFARRPRVIYSDFFGDAPYRLAWKLVHALLAAFLRLAGHRHGNVLATGKARPMESARPQRPAAVPSWMEGNHRGLPASFCRLRRLDLVQHRSIEPTPGAQRREARSGGI
jgi:uncharacterized membrane protein YidH (DUF202 family)